MSTLNSQSATSPPSGTSAGDLLAFWDWALDTGQVAARTGSAYKTACLRVMGDRPDWRHLEVAGLDPEAAIDAFTSAREHDLAKNTIGIYASTFRRALGLFLDWHADPHQWNPDLPRHPRLPPRAATITSDAAAHLRIHLPHGRTAELVVPSDLTAADAQQAMKTLRRVLPAIAKPDTASPEPRT
ncbi:hypothetical protein [Catenulispora rubra]|uniref:hypothetical protein n=1 Tax=Catenulispora rubra TaxID=280293 RepID=UPI0018923815|nr:hypothetical protein [Catenulispora rubra]